MQLRGASENSLCPVGSMVAADRERRCNVTMVRLYVAVTDRGWFDQLAASAPQEVNFWQPSGSATFRALQPGELFLFKLHWSDNVIVGGGVFARASNIPLSMAWEAFELQNGVPDLPTMRRRIAGCRRKGGDGLDERADPVIGARILVQPSSRPREAWLPAPASFSPNTVSGRAYDTAEGDGRRLWDAVTDRLGVYVTPLPLERRAQPRLITPRLGQGAFRLAVTDGYGRRCAVSGERTLPILDAAHIKAYAAAGDHQPDNGLLLRTDIHRLFDLGYVTVSEDMRFEVSSRLRADFQNAKHYYDLHGTGLRPPERAFPPPSREALGWHRENRFLG